jgi:tetrapyrrole methylase family protein / MazG family protein
MPTSNFSPEKLAQLARLAEVIETVHRLRAPGGCPWDRAQTHQTLRQYLIEEAHEVLDVLDEVNTPDDLKKDKTRLALQEELGDVLMQVLLHAEMTREVGAFDFYDVASALNDKLVRRHPHVFGDATATTEESAFETWEKQKAKEKASNPAASVLDGVPKGLPALQRAARVIEKVTKVGFQWSDMKGPLAKIDEELGEFKAEVLALEKVPPKSPEAEVLRKKLQNELGDLLFTVANVGYLMKINPEDALREQLHRFEGRFKHVERRLKEQGKLPEQSNLEEMDRHWNEAKVLEKG